MIEIFLTVLPVFLVLGTGYFGARTGYFGPAVSESLNEFTVRLAVPVLLFRALYRLDLSQAFDLPMLAAFYAGAVVSFVIAGSLARFVWKRRPGESVAVGFCAMFSNTLMLGVPIVERGYGQAALTPAFGIVALHAPILYAIGMVVMELARQDGRPLGGTIFSALKSMLANALMIGIFAGAAFNLVGLAIPEPVMAAIDMISAAAIPAALVGIGAALTRYRMKAEISESLMVSALSLVLHPSIALFLAYSVLGLPAEIVRVAVIVAAMPPGMNVYVFATMYDRAVGLSASTVLIATALSIATISVWMLLLNSLLPL